jgi:hypothetical protein
MVLRAGLPRNADEIEKVMADAAKDRTASH